MYSFLFFLVVVCALLFYMASDNVKAKNKPEWGRKLAGSSLWAKITATVVFLAGWVVAVCLQGVGSGTFAMIAYLMTAYSLIVLFVPLRIFNIVRLTSVALIALIVELFIF
jgi:hypothetical protein